MSDLIKLIEDISSDKLSPLNVLETDDAGAFSFAMEQIKEAIKGKYGEYEYLRKETPEDVLSETMNFSLLGKPRIIVIEVKNIKDAKILEKLPSQASRIFVFIKIEDKIQKFAPHLKNFRHYNLKYITYDEMAGVIKWLFEKHSVSIAPSAMEVLISLYSGNFGELYNEVEKIIVYAGETRKVDLQTLSECLFGLKGKTDFQSIFLSLMEGTVEDVLKKLGSIKEMKKENFIHLMTYIGKQIDQIVRIKEKLRKGWSTGDIMKDQTIFLNTFLKRRYIKLAKKFKFIELYRIYDLLKKYDIPVKWGILSPGIQFEKFVLELFGILK